ERLDAAEAKLAEFGGHAGDAPRAAPAVGASPETAHNLSVSEAKAIVNPGKIFNYNDFLIVTIINEGFHVIDNENPALPQPLFFVNIPGNSDVAVKDNVFFANNYNDLISFTFDETGTIQLIERMPDALQNSTLGVESGSYFECVDPSKGVVVGWESATINNPRCLKQ
ncbi:MAG: hypothetical protein AAFO69_16225, partial [Bacteroidota bacterium]